ncbi:MAG TPA: DUF4337 family protein [Methylovirgula sp.]|jgi:hypothetical protein|nr:DUF4337 family protein [Methylovirgula sp.]
MSQESPTEHLEHIEHAEHAAHSGDSFLVRVSATIAILAVVAATVDSFETIETAATINAKNDAVLLQNKATDTWNFFQAKSVKKNMYSIAAAATPTPAAADAFKKDAARNAADEKELGEKGKSLEEQTEAKLHESESHEHRHHRLTLSVTLLHIGIAIATLAIIVRGARWPFYMAIGLGIAGVIVAIMAYIPGLAHLIHV